jgi:hypothetical protein
MGGIEEDGAWDSTIQRRSVLVPWKDGAWQNDAKIIRFEENDVICPLRRRAFNSLARLGPPESRKNGKIQELKGDHQALGMNTTHPQPMRRSGQCANGNPSDTRKW